MSGARESGMDGADGMDLAGAVPLHVAVIGGGIAGLAAAHALLRREPRAGAAPPLKVTLLEASQRIGGKIRSERVGAEAIDVGAESLMARVPAAIDLCRELGLERELVPARETGTSVWSRGRLRPLPPGILGGLPDGVMPVLRSGILSPAGAARAALDLLLPASRWREDEAVGEIVRRRLGRQALERLFDPLLGTIYAADCDALSARATAPQLDRLARERRSLIRGLIAAKPAAPSPGPLFVTLPGGLERIVHRLAESMRAADLQAGPIRGRSGKIDLRLGTRSGPLLRGSDGRYLLDLSDGERLQLDGVVIAVPADQAAIVLGSVAPPAAQELRSIRYASTVLATLGYPRASLRRPLPGAGVLVPRGERRVLGACTSLSAKWPHLDEGGEVWLRCSVARTHTAGALEADDGTLVDRLAGDLRDAIGLHGMPREAHLTRWEQSVPLYAPGHQGRVEGIERQLAQLPGVALAGAAYRGIGVPQCISQGRAAAQRVLQQLQQETPSAPEPDPERVLREEAPT